MVTLQSPMKDALNPSMDTKEKKEQNSDSPIIVNKTGVQSIVIEGTSDDGADYGEDIHVISRPRLQGYRRWR